MTSRWNLNTANISGGVTDAALGKKVKQCYNDIEVVGSNLTLSNTNSGITKTVSVTGGGTAVQGLNSASLIGNTLSFTKTDGTAADTIDLSTSTLAGSVTTNVANTATNTADISALETNTLNCFESASISGSNLTLTPLSGTATTLTLPAGGTGSGDSISFDVTVQSVSGNNKYFVNDFQGSLQDIEILIGHKYIFNYPEAHPLRFSLTQDGTRNSGLEYTTNVTHNSPGGFQTQTEIIIVDGSEMLYYYCPNHDNMGGFLRIADVNAITQISTDNSGTYPKIRFTRPYLPDGEITLQNSYVSSSRAGQVLTFNKTVGSPDTITLPTAVAMASRTVFYPSTMTANSMGSAIASASSTKQNPSYTGQYEPYYTFDNDDTEDWVTPPNLYSSSDGSYVGNSDLGTSADNGELLKVDLVNPMTATALNLKSAGSYIKPVSTTITFTSGSGWFSSYYYQLDKAQTTTNSVFYELHKYSDGTKENPHAFGLEFRRESDGSTKVYCETDDNNFTPNLVSIGSSGKKSVAVTISGNVGSEVHAWTTGVSYSFPFQFVITADLLFYPEAEIEDFKLYDSLDDTNWVQLLSKTNVAIANTGTNYTLTNTNDYQYYGLVVTKTNISHNHNVSLGQMSLEIEEVFPVPPCQAKASFVKLIDNANNGSVLGVLSNEFNISTISQVSTVYAVARYGVNHRFFSFNVTFTTPLTNANYQVNITEVNRIKTTANYYGCILNHSVMNKQTTGFDIYVLLDPLGFTTSFPSFGLDFMVF